MGISTARNSDHPKLQEKAQRRLNKFIAWAELVPKIASERRQLRGLDERMLKDMGLDRAEVEKEAGRSLLDVPDDRL